MSGVETNQADQTPVDSHAEGAAKPNGTNQNTSPPQPGEVERLREIAALARELVSAKGMINRGIHRGLVVIEKADKSDPHYRLCTALAALTPSESQEVGTCTK